MCNRLTVDFGKWRFSILLASGISFCCCFCHGDSVPQEQVRQTGEKWTENTVEPCSVIQGLISFQCNTSVALYRYSAWNNYFYSSFLAIEDLSEGGSTLKYCVFCVENGLCWEQLSKWSAFRRDTMQTRPIKVTSSTFWSAIWCTED